MSQRLQIVLPDPVALQLHELAAGADTPPSTLAGQMVRDGVALAAKDGKVRPLRPAPVLVGGKGSDRAPWLEPYGGDARLAHRDVGSGRRAARPLPQGTRRTPGRLVDRRLADRDTMRARHVASRNRRHRPRPPRRARLPEPASRLLPRPTPARRRRHQGMEARRTTRGVGGRMTPHPRPLHDPPFTDRRSAPKQWAPRPDRKPRHPASMARTGTNAHVPSNANREEIPMAHPVAASAASSWTSRSVVIVGSDLRK